MLHNCEMQGCQWYGIKRIKSHFREKEKYGKTFSSNFHFFKETDFQQYQFNENVLGIELQMTLVS